MLHSAPLHNEDKQTKVNLHRQTAFPTFDHISIYVLFGQVKIID